MTRMRYLTDASILAKDNTASKEENLFHATVFGL